MRRLLAAILLCLMTTPAVADVSTGKESLFGRIELGRHGALSYAVTRVAGRVVEHPPGCPRRAFCGCGAALDVFKRHVRSLWRAAAWLEFPRTAPAAGMVAANRRHVFVIREVRDGNTVLAYDANSGGRKTRIHLRSLKGFVVVNPHARRVAGL